VACKNLTFSNKKLTLVNFGTVVVKRLCDEASHGQVDIGILEGTESAWDQYRFLAKGCGKAFIFDVGLLGTRRFRWWSQAAADSELPPCPRVLGLRSVACPTDR
jgi:hypothetical protein